jgi:hypothetical protein
MVQPARRMEGILLGCGSSVLMGVEGGASGCQRDGRGRQNLASSHASVSSRVGLGEMRTEAGLVGILDYMFISHFMKG